MRNLSENKERKKGNHKFCVTITTVYHAQSKNTYGSVWSIKNIKIGKKYIMVVTDAFSKYVELIAIPDKQAETVANALFTKWLCRHGLPAEIVSDN